MYYLKEGPGPAILNLRDGNDPMASFKPKKITSTKSGFAMGKREVGMPNPNYENPAPNAYKQDSGEVQVKQQPASLVFNKVPNNLNPARYQSGLEEFTIKGLL